MATTKKVQDLTALGNIAVGDKLVGERVAGSTGLITYTLVGQTWNGNTVGVTYGGTGLSSTTANQLLYSSAANTISEVTKVTGSNTVLASDVSGMPIWSSTIPTNVQDNITRLGSITSGAWQAATITVTYGGTGRATAVAYAPIFGGTTTTGAHQSGTAGTSGQLLQSGGASAVAGWTTATYPTTASTAGKRLKSDGTNLVMSTTTIADSGTLGKVLIGDGTNYIESTPTFPNASATTLKYIKSDGTNWIASTSTLPDSYAQGDIIYASASNVLTALNKNTSATRYLSNTGSSNNPAWAQIDVTNGVTGVLPVANGGTNASSASITAFNNITGYTAAGATGTTSTNLVFSTSPTITTPRIAQINDTNGAIASVFPATASAVNYVSLENSATTSAVAIKALGTDTNIQFNIFAKGTGMFVFASQNTTTPFSWYSGTGFQHQTIWAISNTSANRTITIPDTDITVKTDVGVTNASNATAGNLGETITATGSAVAITNNTQTDVTSISLTAGDWLVYGNVKANPAGTTTCTEVSGGISTTSATLPTIYAGGGTAAAGIATGCAAPTVRINVSSTTTVYLVSRIQYAVSTCTVSGTISGVRIR